MSLTSIIRNNKDLRDEISSTFRRPKIDKSKPLLAEPLTKNHSAVGVAFDYLFRFYLERTNEINNSGMHRWVAESACDRLDEKTRSIAEDIIGKVKKLKKEYIKTGILSRELIKQTLRMSYIDPVHRSGFGSEYIGKDVHELDIDDIEKQWKLIDPSLYKTNNICLLNPTFNGASILVGGADADLIIDDMMIDIKTTKNLNLKLNDFCQIIGYLLLYKISGADCNHGSENSEMKRLGIYYSRYGYLFMFNIEDIIDSKLLDAFITWFKNYIENSNANS